MTPKTTELSLSTQQQLLQVARLSIQWGLEHGRSRVLQAQSWVAPLEEMGASFVTLHKHGQLRGCIGCLEPYRPLVEDVNENAFASAFRDPRFKPLKADEFSEIQISISVLTPAWPIVFDSEADLLQQLQIGKDGLILTEGPHRATFLPSVWEQLPEPVQFLQHLKRKAGLSSHHWSKSIRCERYHTFEFGEEND